MGKVTRVVPEEEAMKAPVGSRHHRSVPFRDYDVTQESAACACAS